MTPASGRLKGDRRTDQVEGLSEQSAEASLAELRSEHFLQFFPWRICFREPSIFLPWHRVTLGPWGGGSD